MIGSYHVSTVLRSAKTGGNTIDSGDQKWSPSRCATRDQGGRAFLHAGRWRIANDFRRTQPCGAQECAPSRGASSSRYTIKYSPIIL
jgi:hypothetical protein